jgi:glycosyl transferase family 87
VSSRATRLTVALLVVAIAFALGTVAASRALWYESTDFFCLWQGARLVANGADPYDESVWRQATGGLYPNPSGGLTPSSCPGRYGYPLWTAVVMLPFGVLPLPAAAIAWMGVSFLAVAIGSAASWRAVGGARTGLPLFVTLVVTAQPLWLLIASGQITGVMVGLVGLVGLFLARIKDVPAGIALGLLVLKPQIAGAFAPLVFLRSARDRPRFAFASLLTLGALAIATVIVSPGWPGEWLAELFGRRLRVAGLLPTAWGLSADLFGTQAVAPLLIAALVLGVALIVRRMPGHLPFAALALPVSLFVSPYAWSYDQLVLVFSWAFCVATASRATGSARTALLVMTALVAATLPWSLYAIAFARGLETLNAVIPALTALLVAGAIRLDRDRLG